MAVSQNAFSCRLPGIEMAEGGVGDLNFETLTISGEIVDNRLAKFRVPTATVLFIRPQAYDHPTVW